jgi:hypothetical protein
MRMSVTLAIDELHALLLQAPTLVARYQNSDPGFIEAVMAWLTDAEATLTKYAMARVAAVSALKARLLAAENGVIESQLFAVADTSRARRKTHAAIAALMFNQGQEIIGSVHETLCEQKEDALKYLRQIVMLLEQQGLLSASGSGSRSQALTQLFATIRANPGSAAAVRHVLTKVNYADALRLLDETLSGWGLEP